MANKKVINCDHKSLVSIKEANLVFTVSKGFASKRQLHALDDISLDIYEKEVVALVGESGSGKTTLGKALLGLYPLTSGVIDLPGASDRASYRSSDLQMVFQDPLSSFNPRFTIGSSIALPMRRQFKLDKEEISRRIEAILVRVGLKPEFADRYPHEMSGGQLQRAAMARVLSLSPRLMVADEAVSKLDVSVRAQILNLIKSLNKSEGIAVVFITHDLGVAQFLADRVVVMYFGRILEVGTATQIMEEPKHPYTAMLMNARKADAPITDEAPAAATGCNFSNRCTRATARCLEQRPPLQFFGKEHQLACFNPL